MLSPGTAGFFRAYISGKKYSNKLVYIVDPQGAGDVAPEEVELLSWADNKAGIFAAHHVSEFYRTRQREATSPGAWVDIEPDPRGSDLLLVLPRSDSRFA